MVYKRSDDVKGWPFVILVISIIFSILAYYYYNDLKAAYALGTSILAFLLIIYIAELEKIINYYEKIIKDYEDYNQNRLNKSK